MSFLRQSMLLNLLYACESGIGFVIDISIALLLGAGMSSDALYAAWLIPQTIGRGLFQSLSQSLLGLYAEVHTAANKATPEHANYELGLLYGHVIVVVALLGLILSVLLPLTGRWWIPLTVSGASLEIQSNAIAVAWIVGCLPLFLALSEAYRSIYYFEERLAWPSGCRIAGGAATVLIFVVLPVDRSLNGIAVAILIGAIVELALISIVSCQSLERRVNPRWPTRARFRKIVRIGGIPMSGVLLLMLAATGERLIASFMGAGTITLIAYANRITTAIERFVFRGVLISATTATLKDGFVNAAASMRVAIFFAIPVAMGLALLPATLLLVVGNNDAFSWATANELALILQYYALSVFGLALSRIPFGYVFALNQSRHVFMFYVLTAACLISVEFALFQFGQGVSLFGIGYSIAMWVGYFYLNRVTSGSLRLSWRSVFWGSKAIPDEDERFNI